MQEVPQKSTHLSFTLFARRRNLLQLRTPKVLGNPRIAVARIRSLKSSQRLLNRAWWNSPQTAKFGSSGMCRWYRSQRQNARVSKSADSFRTKVHNLVQFYSNTERTLGKLLRTSTSTTLLTGRARSNAQSTLTFTVLNLSQLISQRKTNSKSASTTQVLSGRLLDNKSLISSSLP